MERLAVLVRWTWGISVAAQVVLFAVLLLKGNFRKIPVFTTYIALNICQAVFVYAVYYRMGLRTLNSVILTWSSQALVQILRAAATAELLRLILKSYRGIWGFGWRVLTGAFGLVLVVALIASGRNFPWAVVIADRGIHLAFGIAVVACLLLVHHYSIPIHPVYKALLGGFCFYSCTVVLVNTLAGVLFVHGNPNYQMIWQSATLISFVLVLFVWTVALRKPLVEPERVLQAGPQELETSYWEMSPQINERLRQLNDQLGRFWKPEVTRH